VVPPVPCCCAHHNQSRHAQPCLVVETSYCCCCCCTHHAHRTFTRAVVGTWLLSSHTLLWRQFTSCCCKPLFVMATNCHQDKMSAGKPAAYMKLIERLPDQCPPCVGAGQMRHHTQPDWCKLLYLLESHHGQRSRPWQKVLLGT
jgi:hypothetical protein